MRDLRVTAGHRGSVLISEADRKNRSVRATERERHRAPLPVCVSPGPASRSHLGPAFAETKCPPPPLSPLASNQHLSFFHRPRPSSSLLASNHPLLGQHPPCRSTSKSCRSSRCLHERRSSTRAMSHAPPARPMSFTTHTDALPVHPSSLSRLVSSDSSKLRSCAVG